MQGLGITKRNIDPMTPFLYCNITLEIVLMVDEKPNFFLKFIFLFLSGESCWDFWLVSNNISRPALDNDVKTSSAIANKQKDIFLFISILK